MDSDGACCDFCKRHNFQVSGTISRLLGLDSDKDLCVLPASGILPSQNCVMKNQLGHTCVCEGAAEAAFKI